MGPCAIGLEWRRPSFAGNAEQREMALLEESSSEDGSSCNLEIAAESAAIPKYRFLMNDCRGFGTPAKNIQKTLTVHGHSKLRNWNPRKYGPTYSTQQCNELTGLVQNCTSKMHPAKDR